MILDIIYVIVAISLAIGGIAYIEYNSDLSWSNEEVVIAIALILVAMVWPALLAILIIVSPFAILGFIGYLIGRILKKKNK